VPTPASETVVEFTGITLFMVWPLQYRYARFRFTLSGINFKHVFFSTGTGPKCASTLRLLQLPVPGMIVKIASVNTGTGTLIHSQPQIATVTLTVTGGSPEGA
jgi:hypothetical protein